jgi:hypothetical protein
VLLRQIRQQQILAHAHITEQAGNLEAAHQTAARNLVRLESEKGAAVEPNVAAVRPIEARNKIDEGRFASAVWANEAAHFALLDREVDPSRGGESAKSFG